MDKIKWEARLSDAALTVKPSPIRALQKYMKTHGVISFAGGNPDPAVFPISEFYDACAVIKREGRELMQYGPTEGYMPLRKFIIKWMAPRMGRELRPEELMITAGSQEGMDLLSAVMLNIGDTVLTEEPTYPGALHAMRNRGARFLTVPCDGSGMRTDLLPAIIERGRADGHNIKFIYTIVNFQNPSGATLTKERRAELLDIAKKYDLVIFEDDPYGHLRYRGGHQPTIFSMDVPSSGRVVYASSFSKILAPGTRVAWIAGDETIIHKMALIKQGTTMCTSVVAQGIVYEYCRLGYLDSFLPKIIAHYRRKCAAMEAAFKKHLPSDAGYHAPDGGFFFWVRIPGVDSMELFKKGIEHGVAFVNGSAFCPDSSIRSEFIRTCFTFASPENIDEGTKRLADAINDVRRGN